MHSLRLLRLGRGPGRVHRRRGVGVDGGSADAFRRAERRRVHRQARRADRPSARGPDPPGRRRPTSSRTSTASRNRLAPMQAAAGKQALRGGIDLGGTKIQAAIVSPDGKVARRDATPDPDRGRARGRRRADGRGAGRGRRGGRGADRLAAPGSASGRPATRTRRPARSPRPATCPAGAAAFRSARRSRRRSAHRCGSPTTSTSPPTPSSSSAPASRIDSILGVFWGTGVGGGLILDGKRWTGRGAAGEIGHMVVERGGARCPCGRRGCMEAYAGRGAMEAKAREEHENGAKTKLFEIMEERDRDRLTSGIWERALEHERPAGREAVRAGAEGARSRGRLGGQPARRRGRDHRRRARRPLR